MPRGAEYAHAPIQSDNPIDPGETKVHGTNPEHDHMDRVDRTAPLPEVMGSNELHSGQGSRGQTQSGSGKGGHDPKTLGERKGLGGYRG